MDFEKRLFPSLGTMAPNNLEGEVWEVVYKLREIQRAIDKADDAYRNEGEVTNSLARAWLVATQETGIAALVRKLLK